MDRYLDTDNNAKKFFRISWAELSLQPVVHLLQIIIIYYNQERGNFFMNEPSVGVHDVTRCIRHLCGISWLLFIAAEVPNMCFIL